MKFRVILSSLILLIFMTSCSKRIEYSPEYMEQTSGRYLFSQDEVIEIFYDNDELFLKWKGAERIKPVILNKESFFVPDMYKKFHFVQHPETKRHYLSIINKDDESKISYDYLKVEEGFKTPSMHLKDNEYDEALEAYLAIQREDSTSVLIEERDFNNMGYTFIRKKEYDKAIGVLKINVALYPESSNVYDSLGEAYLSSGDSLNAFVNYSKALELDSGNRRAKQYTKAYKEPIISKQ